MRVSFGGGGSEINPFMRKHGGRVLNSTISMYAHASITQTNGTNIEVQNSELFEDYVVPIELLEGLELKTVPKSCVLAVSVTKYLLEKFQVKIQQGIKICTHSDAPIGSGLGASSTMTVAIVHGFLKFFGIQTDSYQIAELAHIIEREYLGLSGGIQDHYCAAFGGFNFMEFGPGEHVLINPLRVANETVFDLESHLVLVYTGTSRESAQIIDAQINAMKINDENSEELLKKIAANAVDLKSFLLKWNLRGFSELLNEGWELKKSLSDSISNEKIELLANSIKLSGATGMKLSGAGGGGYLLVLIKPENRALLLKNLNLDAQSVLNVKFVDHGSEVWCS